MEKHSRRNLMKNASMSAAVTATAALATSSAEAQSASQPVWEKKAVKRDTPQTPTPTRAASASKSESPAAISKGPLFSSIVTFGNLVFLAGIGAHFPGTIEEHTKYVLDELEQNLIAAGSSMQKVLKVNVYLSDLANYARMNTAYQGRFGSVPPVRTTVAVVNGVPGDSLVEIDCIASI